MVELFEKAINIEIMDAHIEAMEIYIKSKRGRAKNSTFKRRRRNYGTFKCICNL
jgi:hypothetical protein